MSWPSPWTVLQPNEVMRLPASEIAISELEEISFNVRMIFPPCLIAYFAIFPGLAGNYQP